MTNQLIEMSSSISGCHSATRGRAPVVASDESRVLVRLLSNRLVSNRLGRPVVVEFDELRRVGYLWLIYRMERRLVSGHRDSHAKAA